MRIRDLLLPSLLVLAACQDRIPTAPTASAPPRFSHTPAPLSVVVAGSLQSEVGCGGDWDPACPVSGLTYDAADDVWQDSFPIPAGSWEYKAALNGGWAENYGAGGVQDGPNIPLNLASSAKVKFFYSHNTHWITSSANAVIATVPGSFQAELGCPGDWDPGCLRSWLQDPDGDGIYSFETTAIPVGAYEAKVAINERWDENYGAGGAPNGPNIPFVVPVNGARMIFSYNATTHVLTITADVLTQAVVNSTADPGDGVCNATECTLREALAAVTDGGEITFAAGLAGTIALSPASGHLLIDRSVTITGPGAGQLSVRGNRDARAPGRVLLVQAPGDVVSISGLTLEKGYVDGPGGCIQNEGSALSLTGVVVAACESWGAGGGIGSTGSGGLTASLALTDVTVRDSWAANGGGGIYNNHSSTLSVASSTVSGNEGREGGGIGSTGAATIVNSTISGNRARAQGGGIYHQNQVMAVGHSTIAFNVSDQDLSGGDGDGGGVYFYGDWGALQLAHTLVALNTNRSGSGPDCARNPTRLPITSTGYNLFGTVSGCDRTGPQTGDVVGTNPLLDPLANNGGPTRTHALQALSPAINAGDPAYAGPLAYDQRGAGYPRVRGGRIDIGAFEGFAFDFSGFFAPVDTLPALNTMKAGQSVPVKFSLHGDFGLSIFAAGYPRSQQIVCDAAAETDGVEETLTAGSSGLNYDPASDTYIYVWKTARSWAGTCRQLVIRLTDGTFHRANFRLN